MMRRKLFSAWRGMVPAHRSGMSGRLQFFTALLPPARKNKMQPMQQEPDKGSLPPRRPKRKCWGTNKRGESCQAPPLGVVDLLSMRRTARRRSLSTTGREGDPIGITGRKLNLGLALLGSSATDARSVMPSNGAGNGPSSIPRSFRTSIPTRANRALPSSGIGTCVALHTNTPG